MTTQTFSYNGTNGTDGSAQDFVVPTGTTSITVDLIGARGGYSVSNPLQFAGGFPGHVAATIAVTPGETLRVYVGGTVTLAIAGGAFNGGGRGGSANDHGAPGGGATDIRRSPYTTSDRLLVAGGGGGAGEFTSVGPPQSLADGWGVGGDAGAVVGTDGTARPGQGFPNFPNGGRGATLTAGGEAGGTNPNKGEPGTFAQGGAGFPVSGGAVAEGGGGGGGYYGGGGGSETAAGGGGTNFVTASATSVTNETSSRTAAHGTATFTYSAAISTLGYTSDIPFIVANDRHQTVLTADVGTSTTTAEFRYFFADAPLWAEELTADTQYPAYHLVDEKGDYNSGTLELPFKTVEKWQEIQVDGVEVEFATRPSSLADDPVASVGFSCRVEGYGISGYGSGTGVATSTTLSYVTGVATQDGTYWPNSRTAYLPVRLDQAVRTARIVLSDIKLVEIKRVKLLGSVVPGRNV